MITAIAACKTDKKKKTLLEKGAQIQVNILW